MLKIQEISQEIGEISDTYIEHLYEESPVVHKEHGHLVINTLPTSAMPIKVADGWHILAKSLNDERDIFMCYAEQGWPMPKHAHLQQEIIEVIDGEITVWIDGSRKVLQRGDELKINSYVPHATCAENGDAKLRITFIPPITRKLDKHAIS